MTMQPGRPYGWVMPPDMLRRWDPNRRLQPLAVVDLLGRTLRLYARNFRTMASIALAVYVPLGLLSGVVATRVQARILELDPRGSPGLPPFNSASAHVLVASAGGSFAPAVPAAAPAAAGADVAAEILRLYLLEYGLTILIGLIGVIAAGAMVHAAVQIYQGRRAGAGAAFGAAFGRLAELVCAELLRTIAIFGFIVVAVAGLILFVLVMRSPLGGVSPDQVGTIVLVGLALGIVTVVITLFASIRLAFMVPAIVLEDRGPFGGLRRSWALTRGSMLRIAGGTLLTGLLVAAVVLGEVLTANSVTGPLENLTGFDAIARIALDTVTSALLAPVTTVFLALLYLDVRVRREDFDLPPSPA